MEQVGVRRAVRGIAALVAGAALAGCVVFGPDGVAVPGTGLASSPAAAAAADSFLGTRPEVVPTTDAESRALNARRAAAGIEPVARNAGLDAVALTHARDVVRTGTATQTLSDGTSAADRIGAVCSRTATEMIAVNVDSFAGALQQWLDRDAARREILRRQWTAFGLGHEGPVWVLTLAAVC